MTPPNASSSRSAAGLWRRWVTGNLQVKILLLVLMPLIVSSSALMGFEAYDRIQANQARLAEQRERLLDSRQQAIRGHVELAQSMVQRIAERVPEPREAKRQAQELLRAMRFDGDGYLFAFRYDGTMLVQPASPESEGTNMLGATDASGRHMIRDLAERARNGGGYYRYDWPHPATGEPAPKYSYAAAIPEWEWVIGAGVYVEDLDAAMADIAASAHESLMATLLRLFVFGCLVNLAITGLAAWLARRTVRQLRGTATSIRDIAREVAAGRGDLTHRLEVRGHDEVAELGEQFNAFLERMQATLLDVQRGAREVHVAAEDIAQGSQELATRTDQAAANLQQTSSAMEEITSTVENNAEHTREADRLVQAAAEVAREGQAAMGEVERTMQDINASSTRIGDIVSMIDAIAFQTNILALNASVEAARAGEHGRGFAVVAQEVRKLAQDSAGAAREIKGLIETSTEHSRHGAEIVQRAGEKMAGIHEGVGQVAAVIAEITAGSREQSLGVGEVNTAVSQLDTMTQENAAMVEQSAGTAAQMREQAERLNRLIGTFVLGEPVSAGPVLPRARQPAAGQAVPARHAEEPEWEAF
ncbi:methyl-accepting chemotaxis protein [Halomonas beimenensis]|uniref:Methyl-accepting chemotaxis protein I n=1 Tax=Halomonas beimenensis TaxID=475662 RepID=A0A291P633_9GAMM|nr:methyl-accepting chemotaxis protein [Halomonas beimenensis]ATJ82331.1 methyl-accepting chemotaxis protein I [Halomonas beimenensis]